jgi:hypothetical protein
LLSVATNNDFEPQAVNLVSIPAVNNNSNFAFRIVSELTNGVYVGAGNTYGGGGTFRFDMVTVNGLSALP